MPRPRKTPADPKPILVSTIENNLRLNKRADLASIKIAKILSEFPGNYQQDILGVVQEAINAQAPEVTVVTSEDLAAPKASAY
jgi:hypothetical protein